MQTNTYVTIQSWMRTELNLSGNELLVYAVIYGFSQDDNSRFSGSRQYLADWCGCTTRNIQNILNDLLEKGLIVKFETSKNGIKVCEYMTTKDTKTTSEKISPPVKKFHHPSEKISPNNIDDTIDDTTIINNCSDNEFEGHAYSKDDFLGSAKKPKNKTHRKSLYDKCKDEIYSYTKDLALQTALLNYLSVRLAIKEKPIYGVNQWVGLLNRLSKTTGNKVNIVEQSTEKGWCSFYPLKSYNSKVEPDIVCDNDSTTEEDRKKVLSENGKRVKF